MKKEIAITAAIFAVLFAFGCTIPGQNKPKPTQYNVTVSPRTIVPGGVSTIKFTVNNKYEATMKNTQVSIGNVPGGFETNGGGSIGDIPPGQSRPQIITIKAPTGLTLQETLTPKISVCYNFTTAFYSDFVFESVENPPTTTVPTHSGYTNGPVSVTLGNNVGYPSSTNKNTITSLTINNIGNGEIKRIYDVNVTITTNTPINQYKITYLKLTFYNKQNSNDCSSGGSCTVGMTSSQCNDLANSIVVGSQAMGTLEIGTQGNVSAEKQYDIQTIRGTVDLEYCYDVDVGSIIVKPVGVR